MKLLVSLQNIQTENIPIENEFSIAFGAGRGRKNPNTSEHF